MRPLPLCALFLVAACARQREARLIFPLPTGSFTGPAPEAEEESEEGEENNERREAWFEHRHQAGPGIDWRALERANGEAQTEKRNQIGRAGFVSASPW